MKQLRHLPTLQSTPPPSSPTIIPDQPAKAWEAIQVETPSSRDISSVYPPRPSIAGRPPHRDPMRLREEILMLQRTFGNQAVGRLLHPRQHREHPQSAACQRQAQLTASSLQAKEIPVETIQQEARTDLPTPANILPSAQHIHAKQNKTGLPDRLKVEIEGISGLALDDVQVHYNSSKPAQLDALAYTQGRDIYMGPGQEKHLAHEAWHVVQQKQGRVRPTVRIEGVAINNEQVLEREANAMGTQSFHPQHLGMAHPGSFQSREQKSDLGSLSLIPVPVPANTAVVQRLPKVDFLDAAEETQVETDITGKKYQEALDYLMATPYFRAIKSANVHSITYDAKYSDYGIAEQDAADPKAHNDVDIRIGPAAYKDISLLVSTLQHELIHAEQYTLPSLDAENIGGSGRIYGYAKEGNSSSSRYIAAAQEIETHCWEIENAPHTSIPRDFLENRGFQLLKYWAQIYNSGKSKGASPRKKGRRQKKSKPRAYFEALKDRVENAFGILKKDGIDIDEKYFKHQKYGLTIP